MADIKISQLPIMLAGDVNINDSIPIVDAVLGVTKQIQISQLDTRFQGVPVGGTTGQVLAKNSNSDKDVIWKTLTKSDVGLSNVDNTSDLNKPISNATQTALNLKADTSALTLKADLSYVNAQLANKQNLLPTGSSGQVLTWVSGAPAWQAPAAAGVNSIEGQTGSLTLEQIGLIGTVVSLGSGVTSYTYTFGTARPDTNYNVVFSFENTTDTNPIFLLGYISAKSTTAFTITLNAPTDTANYKINLQERRN